jgi:gliding motility-associated protein GldM
MAGYKETPRQKMIGMMYLVLTALLALNVSKDIINAFVIVNESMELTNENFNKKLNETYSKFESQAAIAGPLAKQWHDQAIIAQKMSDSLTAYVTTLKKELIIMCDGLENPAQADTMNLKFVNAKNNFDDPTRYFLGTDASKGKVPEIIDKFEAYKKGLTSLVKQEDVSKLKLGLETDGVFSDEYGKKQSWGEHYFYRTILAADIVILNKFIAEIKNAEFDVVSRLYTYIGATDFKFNKIAAKVIPKRTVLFKGEQYEAEVLVAAYDTSVTPNVRYAMGLEKWTAGNTGGTSVTGEKGISMLKIPSGEFGFKKFAGAITIKNPFGVDETYPFNGDFVVQEAMAVVSPDKMSVFYRGLDNPITVSVPGITPESIEARMVSGSAILSRSSAGKYLVKPDALGKVIIEVLAKVDKEQKVMGRREFRVLPVPPPLAIVAGKRSSQSIAANDLAKGQISAVLENFLFDDLKFVVVRFTVSATIGGFNKTESVQGSTMNESARALVQKVGSGQIVSFDNIIVKGPDGREQPISPVNLKIM